MPSNLLGRSIFSGSAWFAAFAALFLALIVAACVTDVRDRRISNRLVSVLAGTGLLFSLSAHPPGAGLAAAFAGMGVGLAIWLPFYMFGVLGAGDVKFFAAASAWLGPTVALHAALLSALAGGILAIVFLLRESRFGATVTRFALIPWTRGLDVETMRSMTPERRRRQLPYGVALGVGVLLAAAFPSLLSGMVER